jgi:DNA-binding transcriptional ArsR family regulator
MYVLAEKIAKCGTGGRDRPAEPTRRAIVERLSRGPASVSDLARPFDMTLAAVVQHLQVLESGPILSLPPASSSRTPTKR